MKLKNILLAIWEFPQNALGFIVKKIYKAKYLGHYGYADVYAWDVKGGISLGNYIFVHKDMGKNSIKHEHGHTIQSKYLGWFYLLVIGLPSLIWAQCFGKHRAKTGRSYYWFYTESWANKLGGVERDET